MWGALLGASLLQGHRIIFCTDAGSPYHREGWAGGQYLRALALVQCFLSVRLGVWSDVCSRSSAPWGLLSPSRVGLPGPVVGCLRVQGMDQIRRTFLGKKPSPPKTLTTCRQPLRGRVPAPSSPAEQDAWGSLLLSRGAFPSKSGSGSCLREPLPHRDKGH